MKKLLLILTTVLVGLTANANLLVNSGFEEGDTGHFGDVDAPGWTDSGDSGWHHDDAGDCIGTKGAKVWWDNGYVYQDFAVTPASTYSCGVQVISTEPLMGWDLFCEVRWLDANGDQLGSSLIGEYIGEKDSKGIEGDPLNTWVPLEANVSAPAGAVSGRFYIGLRQGDNWESTTGGSACFDEAVVVEKVCASLVEPADNSTAYPPEITLSWELPEPIIPGNTVLCDVYFGTDPNFPASSKVIDKQSVSSYLAQGITLGNDYYWKVDSYDVDESGTEIIYDGVTWHFDTNNSLPQVDAGARKKVWLEAGSANLDILDAAVTDDGLPNSTVSVQWSLKEGPESVVFTPSDSVIDPAVTFTVEGEYILECSADDGSGILISDTVKISVFPEGYSGLVAYWALDETAGTVAVDSVSGHDGTIVGDTVLGVEGQVDGAFEFDGDDDYIDCGGAADLNDANSVSWADFREEITVSVWFKGTFDKAYQSIVNKGDLSWRIMRHDQEDKVGFYLNGVGAVFTGSNGTVSDGKWHHVVGTYDGNFMRVYLDGFLAEEQSKNGQLIDTCAYAVRIGSDEQNPDRPFKGLIDDVKIYEIGISSDDVAAEFINAGGHGCGGNYLPGDYNKDCYVNFYDLVDIASNWLLCNDIANPECN